MNSRHISVAMAVAAACTGGMALAADDSNSTLDEVVVTAQFREQSLQSTPLSIIAVSGEMLESRSQTNIAEVASQAPNVTLKPQGAAFGPSRRLHPRCGSVRLQSRARARRRHLCG